MPAVRWSEVWCEWGEGISSKFFRQPHEHGTYSPEVELLIAGDASVLAEWLEHYDLPPRAFHPAEEPKENA